MSRDKFSQFVDVIRAAIPGRKKTYLLAVARMCYKSFIPLLEVAVKKGLIHFSHVTRKYIATDEGARYVYEYDQLRKVLEEETESRWT